MRVLLLASTFHPQIGGAETYALNIARGLFALGHTVDVVTDSGALPPTDRPADGIPIHRLSKYRDAFGAQDRILWEEMAFGLRPELAEIVAAVRPDAIVSNSLDLCVMAKLVSLTQNIPWIACFHEQAPEREPLGTATLQLCYGLLQPDAVIAGSAFYMKRATQFAAHRAHLIYHGIDTDAFRCSDEAAAVVRRQYGLAPDALIVASLGRFKARKGFLDLLEAFAVVPRTAQDLALVIAGSLNSASSEYFAQMTAAAQNLGLSDRVIFDQTLAHHDIPQLLSGADIVVQASLEEGLGLALIEAMSCARAVVATRIPAHLDVLGTSDAVVLADPQSPRSLARAISTLRQDADLRAQLGARARAHVLSRFSLKAMSEATEHLIQTCISTRINNAST